MNKTTVPFNQTTVTAGEANQTTGQQQQPSNATSSQQPTAGGGGGGENLQNNTQGQGNDPLSQMGESLGNLLGQ